MPRISFRLNHVLVFIAFMIFLAGAVLRISAASPTLTITSPVTNSTVYGHKVTVNLAISDFKLVDFTSYSKPVTGQGHIHLWLDTPTPTKESALKLTNPTYTFENLKPGSHTLTAELVANNHTPLTPPVVTTLHFISANLPSPSSTSLLSSPIFQITLFTVIVILVALYFTRLHINNVFESTKLSKKPVPSKSKSKKKSK